MQYVLTEEMRKIAGRHDDDVLTKEHKEWLGKEWSKYAKEKIDVDEIKGTVYGFGSEFGCLRLFYTYHNDPKKPRVGYSSNLKSWYFTKKFN